MPELPEVETVRRGLEPCVGEVVQLVELRRHDLRFAIPKKIPSILKGKKITGFSRRAKYLLWEFDDHILVSHLGMSGSWRHQKGSEILHDHVLIKTDKSVLVYNDPRRFGFLDLCRLSELSSHKFFKHLGPEPLEPEFNSDSLWRLCKARSVGIKNLIMNQQVVVGVGNIYANEALFFSGIRPNRRCDRIPRAKIDLLVKEIKKILARAIQAGGSSIKDFATVAGKPGYFQFEFAVYDRANEPCVQCPATIKRTTSGQRASFYCPSCQT